MWTLLELFIWIIFLYRSFVRWRGGHLFSSLSLKFLAINSCFVGIIVRNFDMVSRFDPRTVLVLEDIVLACFRGDSRLRCGKFSTIALQLVFRGGDRFRGAI